MLNLPASGLFPNASYVFLPMISGKPQVVFLKNRISSGRFHNIWLFFPMALFSEAATIIDSVMKFYLYSYLGFNRGVRMIIFQAEIFKPEFKYIFHIRIQFQLRQRIRCSC